MDVIVVSVQSIRTNICGMGKAWHGNFFYFDVKYTYIPL